MRKVILHNMLTLDGCVSGPNGELDWLFESNDEGRDKYVFELYGSVGGILVGRETYLACADYWPKAEKEKSEMDSEKAFARMINKLNKYVFSKSLETVEWSNSTLLRGNITEEVTRLKNLPGKNLILIGGLKIAQSFIRLGLIDEYHLIMHPVVLGKGKRLFEGLDGRLHLKLANVYKFPTGVIAHHYKKA